MSLVIPPGFGQASVEMRNDGDPQPWYVTFGVDLSDVGGDFQQAALDIATTFGATIGLQLSTTTSVTGCNLLVGQDGSDRLIARANTNIPGETNAAMLPQNCAALYDKLTNLPGRKGRGRFFMPSVLKEASVSEVGVIDGPALADLQLQATAFLEALADGDNGLVTVTPMVVLHNSGISTPAPTPVVSLQVQNVISTQRRRLR